MAERTEVSLEDLVGECLLSGVDFSTVSIDRYNDGESFEDCQVCRFVLNDTTYVAIENPRDGYRSCLRSLKVDDRPIENGFAPVRCFALMKPPEKYDKNDVLQLYDMVTEKVVLEVGTTRSDGYYPSFVAHFSPENMAVNSQVPA